MTAVSQFAYVGIGASKLKEWETFATEILGFEMSDKGRDGTLFLRIDENHHRFIIYPDKSDDLGLIGWQVETEEALEDIASHLQTRGVKFERGTPEETKERHVLSLIKLVDPNGIATEICYGPLILSARPVKFSRPISGFATGAMGFGHVTMAVDSLQKTLEFYRDALGMRISDWVRPQLERAATPVNLVFMHCNNRHHSMAFLEGKFPKRIHHFMVQLQSLDDVGVAYDLCQDKGIPIVLTLGRHTNDQMLSFYMRNPSGFAVEYGYGNRDVDDHTWQVNLYDTGSLWGHRPPKNSSV